MANAVPQYITTGHSGALSQPGPTVLATHQQTAPIALTTAPMALTVPQNGNLPAHAPSPGLNGASQPPASVLAAAQTALLPPLPPITATKSVPGQIRELDPGMHIKQEVARSPPLQPQPQPLLVKQEPPAPPTNGVVRPLTGVNSSRIKCFCCNNTYRNVSLLKYHLTQSHFLEEILAAHELKSFGECPRCGKRMKQGKHQLATHLGTVHRKLFDLVTRENQPEIYTRVRPRKKEPDTKTMAPAELANAVKCYVCHKILANMAELRTHLTLAHFLKEIIEMSGVTPDANNAKTFSCTFCSYTSPSKQAIGRHVGLKHGLLKDLMRAASHPELFEKDEYDEDYLAFKHVMESVQVVQVPLQHIQQQQHLGSQQTHIVQQHLQPTATVLAPGQHLVQHPQVQQVQELQLVHQQHPSQPQHLQQHLQQQQHLPQAPAVVAGVTIPTITLPSLPANVMAQAGQQRRIIVNH